MESFSVIMNKAKPVLQDQVKSIELLLQQGVTSGSEFRNIVKHAHNVINAAEMWFTREIQKNAIH